MKTAKADKVKDRKNETILVVRRIINSKGIHVDTEVDIKSVQLVEVLLDLNKDVDGLSLHKTPAMVGHLTLLTLPYS